MYLLLFSSSSFSLFLSFLLHLLLLSVVNLETHCSKCDVVYVPGLPATGQWWAPGWWVEYLWLLPILPVQLPLSGRSLRTEAQDAGEYHSLPAQLLWEGNKQLRLLLYDQTSVADLLLSLSSSCMTRPWQQTSFCHPAVWLDLASRLPSASVIQLYD